MHHAQLATTSFQRKHFAAMVISALETLTERSWVLVLAYLVTNWKTTVRQSVLSLAM